MSKTAKITIKRGVPGEAPCLQTYEVPYQDGMTVLDAIVWIRSNIDSSLAFRYSCINANACKECLVAVNGETQYACTTRLARDLTAVGPLPNKLLIKDLVTDIVPPRENLRVIISERRSGSTSGQ